MTDDKSMTPEKTMELFDSTLNDFSQAIGSYPDERLAALTDNEIEAIVEQFVTDTAEDAGRLGVPWTEHNQPSFLRAGLMVICHNARTTAKIEAVENEVLDEVHLNVEVLLGERTSRRMIAERYAQQAAAIAATRGLPWTEKHSNFVRIGVLISLACHSM